MASNRKLGNLQDITEFKKYIKVSVRFMDSQDHAMSDMWSEIMRSGHKHVERVLKK